MKNVLLKDTVKEIKNTFKRFLSILLVVLLGVGFFAGIKATSPDMKKTIDIYFDEQNVMDIQVISTLGLTNNDIEILQNIDGVEDIEGSYSQDAIIVVEDKEIVVKLETINSRINNLVITNGRMPENSKECVIEEGFMKYSGYNLEDIIKIDAQKIKDDEGNEKELLKESNVKIVGTIRSPMYISRERGSSKLGSGKVNYYMYIPKDSINANIFTTAYIKVQNTNELECYRNKYEDVVKNVKDKIEGIAEQRKQARYNEIYKQADNKIKDAQKTLNSEKQKAEKEIKNAQNKINNAKKEVQKGKTEITSNRKKADEEFKSAESKITNAQKELDLQVEQFNVVKNSGQLPEEQLIAMESKLNEAQKELNSQKSNLQKQKESTYAQLNSAENELKKAETQINQNEIRLAKEKKEADKKIKEAEEKLEDAKLKLADIKKPEWYILDRNQNNGYASYMQDTDRIANLATVFPVVFFVVAALISLTSMTRMVEEERVQIGTLKALGYTKLQIASKYIIYALLATIIGSVIGLVIGFNLIPKIITDMYAMMYTLPEMLLEFNIEYTLISVILALACTVGATIYSCIKELLSTPANLMRPKAPKPGKRVFLENIKFVWDRLKFTQKVTARNIFRYKKRFLMTIIGVMGSTALILTGFGIRDAISKMIPAQYGDIFKYDIQISLKDTITQRQINKEAEDIRNIKEISDLIKLNMQAIEITSIENTQNIQLIVPEEANELSKFISLKSRTKGNADYELNNDGVVITEKLATLLELKVGDKIQIKNNDDIQVETKISCITENYLMHYIYMSKDLYEDLYKEPFRANTIFANINDLNKENEIGEEILKHEEAISGINLISSSESVFAEVMDKMSFVVWVLIVSAGLLAFVVLYNLANTNISERIRELATIKVLGFYDGEVYDYISKETRILTIIGMFIGLFAGYFLTMFIIKTCELDLMMFSRQINAISFVYAVLITIVFSVIVEIATYFSLKKIDMIESLKSIE